MPEVFGPYLVHDALGAGGMATVHRAMKQGIEGFERPVALKRLHESVSSDESFVRGFVREARLAASLTHTNIAQIYDLGRVGETYYIAMELVAGYDLRQILKHAHKTVGPVPYALVLNILAQICDALDYAHNVKDSTGRPLGLVHRDISPANLIVGADGVVKVIDFGIAKAAGNTVHTATGILKGKFSYIAPEYLATGKLDGRSDLFGLGVVGYELLTARPLFKGNNDYETLEQVRYREVPPPSTINPEVPGEVDTLILQTLAKDPAARWPNAGTMRRAIDKVRSRLDAHAANATVFEWIDWAMKQTHPIEDLSALAVESNTRSVVMEVEQRTIIGAAPAAVSGVREVVTVASAPIQTPGGIAKTTLAGWHMQKSPLPPAAYPVALPFASGTAPPAIDNAPTIRDTGPLLPPQETRAPVKKTSPAVAALLVLLLCAVVAVGVFALLSYFS